MHIQTHIMSGWCLGNCFKLNPRERFFCMLAASLQDLDGLGIVFSQELYWDYHHILGHNLLVGVIISVVLAAFSEHRLKAFLLYAGLFHLHLLMDFFGSGELWTISYLWPFSDTAFTSSIYWPLFSWQNILAGFVMLAWTVAIAAKLKRSPVEYLIPKLDKQIVEMLSTKIAWFQKPRMNTNGRE